MCGTVGVLDFIALDRDYLQARKKSKHDAPSGLSDLFSQSH